MTRSEPASSATRRNDLPDSVRGLGFAKVDLANEIHGFIKEILSENIPWVIEIRDARPEWIAYIQTHDSLWIGGYHMFYAIWSRSTYHGRHSINDGRAPTIPTITEALTDREQVIVTESEFPIRIMGWALVNFGVMVWIIETTYLYAL